MSLGASVTVRGAVKEGAAGLAPRESAIRSATGIVRGIVRGRECHRERNGTEGVT